MRHAYAPRFRKGHRLKPVCSYISFGAAEAVPYKEFGCKTLATKLLSSSGLNEFGVSRQGQEIPLRTGQIYVPLP